GNQCRGRTPETAAERVNPAPIPVAGTDYRYHGASATPDAPYYALSAIGQDGRETSLAQTLAPIMPTRFSFGLAGENPFHGATTLVYALAERAQVRIEVFNVAGQRVRTLVDQELGPGAHQVPFTLAGTSGARLAPGIYLVHIAAGREQRSVRVVALN